MIAPSNRSRRTYYDTLGWQISEFLSRSSSPLTLVVAFSFVLLCLLVVSTPFLPILDSLNTFFDVLPNINTQSSTRPALQLLFLDLRLQELFTGEIDNKETYEETFKR